MNNSTRPPENDSTSYVLECIQSNSFVIIRGAVIAPMTLSVLFGNVLVLASIMRFSPVQRGMKLLIGM